MSLRPVDVSPLPPRPQPNQKRPSAPSTPDRGSIPNNGVDFLSIPHETVLRESFKARDAAFARYQMENARGTPFDCLVDVARVQGDIFCHLGLIGPDLLALLNVELVKHSSARAVLGPDAELDYVEPVSKTAPRAPQPVSPIRPFVDLTDISASTTAAVNQTEALLSDLNLTQRFDPLTLGSAATYVGSLISYLGEMLLDHPKKLGALLALVARTSGVPMSVVCAGMYTLKLTTKFKLPSVVQGLCVNEALAWAGAPSTAVPISNPLTDGLSDFFSSLFTNGTEYIRSGMFKTFAALLELNDVIGITDYVRRLDQAIVATFTNEIPIVGAAATALVAILKHHIVVWAPKQAKMYVKDTYAEVRELLQPSNMPAVCKAVDDVFQNDVDLNTHQWEATLRNITMDYNTALTVFKQGQKADSWATGWKVWTLADNVASVVKQFGDLRTGLDKQGWSNQAQTAYIGFALRLRHLKLKTATPLVRTRRVLYRDAVVAVREHLYHWPAMKAAYAGGAGGQLLLSKEITNLQNAFKELYTRAVPSLTAYNERALCEHAYKVRKAAEFATRNNRLYNFNDRQLGGVPQVGGVPANEPAVLQAACGRRGGRGGGGGRRGGRGGGDDNPSDYEDDDSSDDEEDDMLGLVWELGEEPKFVDARVPSASLMVDDVVDRFLAAKLRGARVE